MENILDTVRRIHFVGIGGSGICPIAEILLHKGYQISGSDLNESDTLDRVKTYGIPVYMGHRPENVGDAQCVVYTSAAKPDNPELVEARRRGIPTLERSEMLGMLSDRFREMVGIAATHGKTTTSSMLTQITLEAGRDPSAIIGGKLPLLGSNSRVGKSQLLVCEADEYKDTFLHLHPAVAVLLNLEVDHLDYFKDLDHIVRSFHQYAEQTREAVIFNGESENLRRALQGISGKRLVSFGLGSNNDYWPGEITPRERTQRSFTLMHGSEALGRVDLQVPGMHNVLDAVAAGAAAHVLGISGEDICRSLSRFTGTHRRFELLGNFGGIQIADDFAHHPTELRATLTTAMEMGYREVWAIFQPHTYSRTYDLLEDFAQALAIPDHVIMTEILAVREENVYGIHTSDLAAKIPGSVWFSSFAAIEDYVMERAQPGDLILTLGGGDIYKCANQLVDRYRAREER